MSISTLIVAVRTTGAAGLTRLGAGFTRLHHQAQAASAGIGRNVSSLRGQMSGFTQSLTRLGQSLQRGILNGLDTLGDALKGIMPTIAKWGAIIAAIVVFAVPATAALVSLAGAVQLLAPATIAAISAFAALKLGLQGVGGAISAGLSGDMEAFHKALKKLAPSAREFATSAVRIGKSWRAVQRATQQSLFGGGNLPHWLRRLAIDFKPIAMKWLPAMADGFSKAGRELSMFLIDPGTKSQIEGILANVKRFLDGILAAITPLTQAFLDIAEVAGPLFGDMGQGAGTLAEKFAAFIREAKESGKLAAWLNSAKEALKTLGQISGDVKNMLGAIWTGGKEGGQGLLDKIRELTAAFAAWLQTDDGQEMIDFIGFLAQATLGLIGVVKVLSQVWIGMTWGMAEAFAVLVASFLTGVGVIINGAARAWGWIPGIGPKLQQAAADFNAFRDSVNASLAGIHDEQVVVSVMTRTDGGSSAVSNALSNGISRSRVQFRAAGGPVSAGRSYIVGERGPELVTMGGSGRVTNARDTASMMSGGATQLQLVAGAGGDGLIAGVINKLVRTGQLKLKVVGSRVVPA